MRHHRCTPAKQIAARLGKKAGGGLPAVEEGSPQEAAADADTSSEEDGGSQIDKAIYDELRYGTFSNDSISGTRRNRGPARFAARAPKHPLQRHTQMQRGFVATFVRCRCPHLDPTRPRRERASAVHVPPGPSPNICTRSRSHALRALCPASAPICLFCCCE